jgi:hypothetical protein
VNTINLGDSMSSREKLIQKILDGTKNISFDEVENFLRWLGFKVKVSGSHYIFRKEGIEYTVSLKKRPQLLTYQIDDVREALIKHGYKEK